MSDFAAFEGADPPADQGQVEEDPAAAFLAREKDEMAELEDDGFGLEQAAPAAEPAQPAAFVDDMAAFGEDSFDPLDSDTNKDMGGTPGDFYEPVTGGDYGDTVVSDQDAYAAIKQADKVRTEPEKIKMWREEQKQRLEEKDAESEKRKTEWREIAKKELEDWYKHSQEQLEKTKQNNREAEVAFIQDRDASVPGQDWERICRMCDFNPKTARNARDVSRMRSILLQLKQTPLTR